MRAFAVSSALALSALAWARVLPAEQSHIEVLAVVTGVWSVWFLSRNDPFGWWIGLVSVAGFAVVFFEVRLYAEVGIQLFYFVTSLQAIYIWLRGGSDRSPRPISHVPRKVLLSTFPVALIATVALRWLLIEINGAAPGWDAISTVMSLTAHIYLMWRYVESWWVWIAVDVIYVPLYASRGLELTSFLYAGFLVMSIFGLRRFQREARERELPELAAA